MATAFADDSFSEAERQFRAQYDITEVLGEGTYGKVRKGRCRQTGEFRALKQMKLGSQEDGVPSTAIREIAILKELSHENIVQLIDVFCKPGEMCLVFELLDSDLKKYMKALGGCLQSSHVRDFARQLLSGIEFCHANRIIHRDLKPQNLLIDSGRRRMKIADFGLARAFSLPVPQYTHEVVTVWYRPLEILLGSKLYSIPVDMWGVGCILAEMATGHPLFAGDSEIDTAFKIFQKLGTPTEAVWPGLSELPDFKPTFPQWKAKGWANIRNTLAQLGNSGVDLLEQLTRYNPSARISAREALQHAYLA
jgi:serine/threonine protein kinase